MITIIGTVKKINYHCDGNGFTIARFETNNEIITIKGNIEFASVGLFLKLSGDWVTHPTFGPQFEFKTAYIDTPISKNGLIQYLASGSLPGIGEKKAEDIVNHFGKNVLDILDDNPERLKEISGIGEKTVGKTIEAYKAQKEFRKEMIKLQGIGISSAYSTKLYNTYKEETLTILYSNPYQIIKDVDGIGFKIADHIASLIGITGDNPQRIEAGILHAIDHVCQLGDTFITRPDIIQTSKELLNVEQDAIEGSIDDLVVKNEIIKQIINNETVYYLPYLLKAEKNIAESLMNIDQYPCDDLLDENELSKYEVINNFTLDAGQKDAIRTSMDKCVSIITGGPGTGKTTIISAIIHLFSQHSISFELCAPTGRASKRMSESTGHPASTIHRLLEFGPDRNNKWCFKRNRLSPLECDAVIVDEVSMVDTPLMSNLLSAMTPGMRLILVGDVDQLPSVGPGQILSDLVESGRFAVSRLSAVHRQANGSEIANLAQLVNRGKAPKYKQFSNEVRFRKDTDQEESLKELIQTVLEHPETQVLTPMKKGLLGTVSINAEIQKRLNPPAPFVNEVSHGNVIFRENDRVMQVKNNYKMPWVNLKTKENGVGVFNGDTGKILIIDKEEKTVTVMMDDDKVVIYSFSLLNTLIHSYAITIHKSQGSEFSRVAIPLIGGPPSFTTKKLIYTAITRAKGHLTFVGEWRYLMIMINSRSDSSRKTGLTNFLI